MLEKFMHLIIELWGAYLSAAWCFRSLTVLGNKSIVIEGKSYSLVMFIQSSWKPPRLSKLTVITIAGLHSGKESACQCLRCRKPRKYWFNPWMGKIPGVGNGNPLQYSCLENSMYPWTEEPCRLVHGITKNQTRLSKHTHTHTHTEHMYIHAVQVYIYTYIHVYFYKNVNSACLLWTRTTKM